MEPRDRRRFPLALVAAVCAGLLASACDEKKKERPQTQVAARVDGHEITLPQIGLVLEQQNNLRPEQVEAASRQVLARLVDQRLLAAQAERLQLERDPRVRERIDAATREILARAYADRLDDKLQPPTPADVEAYYRAHPERFAQRRIYTLQELLIDARPEQIDAVRAQLQAAASVSDVARELDAGGTRYTLSQAVRAAEQLPPQALQVLVQLHDGQAVLLPTAKGALVMVLLGSRSEPLSLEQARPSIEPMLLAERRRKLLELELQSLRQAARIDYKGRFAPDAAASGPEPADAADRDAAALPAFSSPPAQETSAHKDPP